MKMMEYKGYQARIEYDGEDKIFVGHLAGIRAIVGFHGESVPELESALHDAVNDYLAHCAEKGISPQRPYSGKVMLRISPELHALLAMRAEAQNKSLNQYAAAILAEA